MTTATVVHEDQGSILVTDREPVRWEADGQRGFAWSERVDDVSGTGICNWRDAACAGAACGLVVDARRSFLHSSVAGVAPVYFHEHEGAIYFATVIDALALASPRRLSVDWEAWAATLAMDHPLGDRTPFAEIRRLPPFSTLEVARGKARRQRGTLAVGRGRTQPRCRRRSRRSGRAPASVDRAPACGADRVPAQRRPRFPPLPRPPGRASSRRRVRPSPSTPTPATTGRCGSRPGSRKRLAYPTKP